MVVVDLKKCVGCGTCQMVCPQEAIYTWTRAKIDRTRCTDCQRGRRNIENDTPLSDKKTNVDTSHTHGRRACVENCPQAALSVESQKSNIGSQFSNVKMINNETVKSRV